MEQQSHQRVALVTGAGRGIGRAIAVALAREGFALCIAARTREQLDETRALTCLPAALSLIVLVDLADSDAPDNLFGAMMDHFGRIDLLINNAGFAPPRTALVKTSAADQDRMIAVNLRAPIALARLAAAQMARRGEGGTIINIASSSARFTPVGEAIYAATKAGLVAFTHACFAEFRDHRVRIAALLPGLTDTPFIPNNKRLERTAMLRAEDVAAAVLNVVNAPPGVSPIEIVLEPALDPMRGGR
ncbi:MAG TPA: SDR family oxidoreductase [Candidatus Binataceae bacterium]|nr:SDR family oxidoreductase [Candidatus Binataceae bacterium]